MEKPVGLEWLHGNVLIVPNEAQITIHEQAPVPIPALG
jgi:hypothetical protein